MRSGGTYVSAELPLMWRAMVYLAKDCPLMEVEKVN